MSKVIKELEELFLEYKNSNDQNAYIAVRECINIVKRSDIIELINIETTKDLLRGDI